jgi:transcriptional regulator with XRE-family HTH domain
MTASLAEFSYPLHATASNGVRRSRRHTVEHAADCPSSNWRSIMATFARSHSQTGYRAAEASLPVSPPGVIGGAITQAARRSAGLTRGRLARMLAVDSSTVRHWESGAIPLFSVWYSELCRLAAVLGRAGATVGCNVSELILASQCDLLVTGMLRGFEDYAEVPPVDEDTGEGTAARDLLRWALTGVLPEGYRPFASAGPLLAKQDLIAFAALAHELRTGSRGNQLASYGRALAALTMRPELGHISGSAADTTR